MNTVADAFLRSWPLDPWLSLSLSATATVYVRGWLILRRRDPQRWHWGRPTAFISGLGCIFLALASPIEVFAGLLLQVHMVQHLLLMMVAPPLVWLGHPLFPMLRGLPREIRTVWIAPLFRWRPLRRLLTWLTHPVRAWIIFAAVTWGWHIPTVYETALRSSGWHVVQHLSFLIAALIFWYPVVRPYPSRPSWPLWLLVPYLLLADVQNTMLSALFTFSSEVLYPTYAALPRIGGMSALDDQATAGVIMWVPGSLAYLLPLFIIGARLLFGTNAKTRKSPQSTSFTGRLSLPVVNAAPGGFDVLRLPVVGRLLRWRHSRITMQTVLLLLAVVVIYDGFTGPEAGAMNLAGVLPWIHWRGLVVFGLLIAGNIFCMGCPFLLPRTVARRWLSPARAWPRRLRNKWVAVVLLVAFLWAYEAFALWDRPLFTAWIAIGYFTAPLVTDGLFRGAPFCKYICPIGQFNFVNSLVSPLEVKVRDPIACAACQTKDCIRGRDGIPGCELHLFQPRKSSNLDCTFCLDCVHACPHDNVGITPVVPASALWNDTPMSGIGRMRHRPDLAVLCLILVFGAFANAAGMVGPVVEWQQRSSSLAGCESLLPATAVFFVVAVLVVPTLTVGLAAIVSRRLSGASMNAKGMYENAIRFSYCLIPLGFGMWLAHYGFHFGTSYDTIVPVGQRFLTGIGFGWFDEPTWIADCCAPVAAWLLRLEILFLDVGMLGSLYCGFRVAKNIAPNTTGPSLLPWAVLIVALFAIGVWILFQPMEMRGTIQG